MKRRDFMGRCVLRAIWPSVALAQSRAKTVGIVWHAGSAEEEAPYFEAFHRALLELGYVEGKTIVMADRFPNEKPERFESSVAELVASPADVLVAVTLPAALAAQRATRTIPIGHGRANCGGQLLTQSGHLRHILSADRPLTDTDPYVLIAKRFSTRIER